MIIWLYIATTIVCVSFTIGLIRFIVDGLILHEWHWILLSLIVVLGICLFCDIRLIRRCQSAAESESEIISTTTRPQIDTTITYANGVTDTVYTYHIIKKQ